VKHLTITSRPFVFLLIVSVSLGSGCSLLIDSHARKVTAQRQHDADMVLKDGTDRSAVVEKLGDPERTQTANGLRTDTYYLRAIPAPSESSIDKWERVDLEFLLLPEVVMTPAAIYGDYFSANDRKMCRVSYGRDDRITRTECEMLTAD